MINKKYKIFIRKETCSNEFRCPIIPADIIKLNNIGFDVYVESSLYRCFNDNEYIKNGAIIINDSWFNYNDYIIIGLKKLNDLNKLNNHIHVYFSHSYKNQNESNIILSQFKKSNSILYDFEYFLENNKRIIAFGYYAGISGCGLGLLQFLFNLKKQKIVNLKYWCSIQHLINDINLYDSNYNNITNFNNIKICVIGSNGRCGNGVQYLLKLLNINYFCLNKNDDKCNLIDFDIIFNCINLQENIGVWFDENTKFYKNIIIVDISCDYNNPNNPIKIYNNNTTCIQPVFSYNNYVDIIAINNLPSLLPKDSSTYFSNILTILLLEYDKSNSWINNMKIYYENINKK